MQNNSSSRQMLVKRELVNTTNTTGWLVIQQMAEATVADMERRAIDEEDDLKGNNLRREAKAARQFLTTFLRDVNSAKQVDDESIPVSDFVEIAFE